MEQARRVLASIQQNLGSLTGSQKLLIASVLVVLVMSLFVVQQYSGRPDLSPLLPGYGRADQEAAARFLRTNGVPFEYFGGEVMVPAGEREQIHARMAQDEALPSDTQTLFDNLIDKQSWTMSTSQNKQLEVIAVQNELGRIISNFSGVREARVILNIPERRGLGQPAAAPSASATIFSEGGMDQNLVDSVAGLIAGSRGIDVSRVRVVDGTTNRQWKPKTDDGAAGVSNALDLLVKIEERQREKLLDMLSSYIRGVIVTVHAQVDVKRVTRERVTIPSEGKGSWNPVVLEDTVARRETSGDVGGEPGVRSNAGADVAAAGGGGPGSEENSTLTEFAPVPGREVETVVDPRGHATKINAVVNIPRSYFVDVWRLRGGGGDEAGEVDEGAGGPTDADLEPIRVAEVERIRREVEKVIDTSAGDETQSGEVEVSMIPMNVAPSEPVQAGQGLFGPGGVGSMDEVVKTAGLALLAVTSLALLAVTAFRASKREPLPPARELVGIPPALADESDLVGEALEADSQLEGIELDEEEIRTRKQLEQVSELVQEKPDDAASLLSKWIASAE